ncbi:MAG: hypothetical protein QXU69_06175 [Thermofilaceae archaeon]
MEREPILSTTPSIRALLRERGGTPCLRQMAAILAADVPCSSSRILSSKTFSSREAFT